MRSIPLPTPRRSWLTKAATVGFCVLVGACTGHAPTTSATPERQGLVVDTEPAPDQSSTLLVVKGAIWMSGGDVYGEFRRQAAALARKQSCTAFRTEGLQESQENALFGTQRILRGKIVCDR